MSAEVTAGIMIGPIHSESSHGTPSGLPGGRLFAPSHVLVLMENSRATWVVQRCPELHGAQASRRIQPLSPAHLLAAATLGYTALVTPDAVADHGALAGLTFWESPRVLGVVELDDDMANHIYEYCSKHVYAVVTRLAGSTIQPRELEMAASAGMQIAIPGGEEYAGHGT